MLIILPPSETKAAGGNGPALDLGSLSFPQLTETRREILEDLRALDVGTALGVLGISESLRGEAEANLEVLSSPTMPALHRFTGVLFDALNATSLPQEAWGHLAVGDALFGVVMAQDLIPKYRLSGGTKLPDAKGNTPTMKARWGTQISRALEAVDGLVVDLRSGTYQQLGKRKGAVTVRVETEAPDGTRKVVSHFNKHYKGLLARDLALAGGAGAATPATAEDVAEIARAAGHRIELDEGSSQLTMVVS
ncbi:peroxide stress protein YaaA [Corynebacterium kozikiae]|uniref:peroxide stress protein YaaA n=1 Tax=Corynebacterium kozikiae TaxID=2968469 RepID=UPI00211CDBE2|nr:peroxide stress protein YaaA [Corynebacterium sp. 76QC2CO]MCQ9342402.1 peroxide stress protein YaaA [Corynebacterium sp. 76QC2CO]